MRLKCCLLLATTTRAFLARRWALLQRLQRTAREDASQAALDRLPERQRQAVALRHIDGLANPEIATILDVGVEAVESLTARGKRALAKLLGARRDALGYDDDKT